MIFLQFVSKHIHSTSISSSYELISTILSAWSFDCGMLELRAWYMKLKQQTSTVPFIEMIESHLKFHAPLHSLHSLYSAGRISIKPKAQTNISIWKYRIKAYTSSLSLSNKSSRLLYVPASFLSLITISKQTEITQWLGVGISRL